MRHCISILVFLIFCANVTTGSPFNQDPGNPNLDFSAGHFGYWQLSWGNRGNPYATVIPSPAGNSHTIVDIYGTNWDGNAGNGKLKRVPDGLEKVVRLGDPAGGGYGTPKSYAMRYNIRVNASYPILFFQLASVMDQTHTASNNTYYKFSIRDSNGNPLLAPPCGGLEMSTRGSTVGGSNIITNPVIPYNLLPEIGTIAYQPWQSVAIDVSAYAGQTITIAYEHNDCYTGHHGSYTYLSAAMRSDRDTFYFCRGTGSTTIKPYQPNFTSYQWNTGATTDSLVIRDPVDGAVYTCRVSSYNGCSTTFTYVLKEVHTEAAFDFIPSGGCNQMQFTDRSFSNPGTIVEWLWDFGDPASGAANQDDGPQAHHKYPRPGSYNVSLTVTDTYGCSRTLHKVVAVSPEGTVAQLQAPATFCAGDTLVFKDITLNSIGRSWIVDDELQSETASLLRVPAPLPGNRSIVLIATGSNGCPDTLRENIEIHALPAVAIAVTPPTRAAPVTHPEFTFKGNAPDAVRYEWDFGYGNLTATGRYSSCVYPSTIASYRVQLGVYDHYECYNSATVKVSVRPEGIMMPNAFSPNGDGLNDRFQPINITNQTLKEFSIFNRYGHRVFYALQAEAGWDGTYLQQPCDPGIYYYRVRYSVPGNSEEQVQQGEVTLVR